MIGFCSSRRSKTDQRGAVWAIAVWAIAVWANPKEPGLCPARALQDWLGFCRAAGDHTGGASDAALPLFVGLSKAGKLSSTGLSDKAVRRLFKQAARDASLANPEGYSSHSLRAGLATAAGEAGADLAAVMRQTRHRSAEVALMRDLARLRRRAAGRRSQPRLAIIDTQTVKCLSVRGPRGSDAAKRVVGRKRIALVDAEGHWLAVTVAPASVQERDTLTALDGGKAARPSLRVAILDGAFTAERCQVWSNLHGMRHDVVTRNPGQKRFAVLPRRWVVERSFGWLTHWGGLLRDRAGRLDVAAARIECAAVLAATEALINPA